MLLPLSLLACSQEQPQAAEPAALFNPLQSSSAPMEVSRSAARPASPGPAAWFAGTATITRLFDPEGSSQVGAALVRFQPGARTAWHRHPLGQRLIVTDGSGWTQVEGGPVEVIRPGDVVWCPPGVRH
jgi:quercetin dioxygenase-like cupin family protein